LRELNSRSTEFCGDLLYQILPKWSRCLEITGTNVPILTVTIIEAFFQETFRNRFYTEFNNNATDGLLVDIRWQTDRHNGRKWCPCKAFFHYFTMNVSQPVSLCCSILWYPLHPSTQNDTNVCFWCPFFQMEFKLLLSRPFPTRLMCNKKASSKQSNLEGNYSFYV